MSHRPRKRFGQNFLRDEAIIQAIVNAIQPQAGDLVVEIGPGQGALTTQLLPTLASMHAVELDRDLLEPLLQTCKSLGNLDLHAADALKFDYCQLSHDTSQKLRVVGNLPYNISSPLLFHLVQYRHCIRDMHFMLQKEVVQRITASPGTAEYGRLGIMLQYFCEAELLFTVPPEAFFPPPKVDSAVFRLIPRPSQDLLAQDEELLSRVVAMSFSQRRKTIRNNLKSLFNQQAFDELGIDPGLRPQQLLPEQFIQLANWLHAHQ